MLLLSPLFFTVGDISMTATRGLRFNQQRHFLQCTICGVNATCGIKCRAICGIHTTCGIRSSRCATCHLRHLPPAAVRRWTRDCQQLQQHQQQLPAFGVCGISMAAGTIATTGATTTEMKNRKKKTREKMTIAINDISRRIYYSWRKS